MCDDYLAALLGLPTTNGETLPKINKNKFDQITLPN